MTDKKPEELSGKELDNVQGAGLLLPAVQAAKDARAASGPKASGSAFIGETEKNLKGGKGAAAKGGSKLRPSDKWIADGGDTNI